MATTINSYSVGFGMDASSYIQGARISRSETKMLTADINAARSPSENFQRAHDRLTKAYQSGAIELSTYNRLLDSHKSKMEAATTSTTAKASSLEKLSQVANIATGAIATVRAGIDSVRSVADSFFEVAAGIDETTKSAQKLGLTFNELSGLGFAASEAGVSTDQIERGIKEMIKKGFSTGDARESFMQIADEIKGMATQSERIQRAYEVFGKSGPELVAMLQNGRDAIQSSVDFSERWNSLTETQVISIEQMNDTWNRIQTIIDGTTNKIVAEFAPAITLIGEKLLGSAESWEKQGSLITEIVDMSVYFVGVLSDVNDLLQLQQRTMFRIAALDFTGIGEDWKQAFTFDGGDRMIADLEAKRRQLADDALQRMVDLERKKKAMQQETIEENASLQEEKLEDFASMYQKGISAATKMFEDKAKEAKRIADSIAKGPSDLEVGSGAAAKFMADQANRAIAEQLTKDIAPGEEALLDEARRQIELMIEANIKQEEQVTSLKQLIEITSQNGFKRLR